MASVLERLTAVQLRDEPNLTCRLLHGTAAEISQGELGPIHLFKTGMLVAYYVETPVTAHLFVFRTLPAAQPLSSHIPGVHPAVDLLLETRTRGSTDRACNLVRRISKTGYEVESLSDAFWLRLSSGLAGRRPSRAPSLPALLERETR